MSEPLVIEAGTIAKLDARAGDVLLVQLQQPVSDETASRIGAYINSIMPEVSVLVLGDGATASIVRQEPM